jgi:AraC-like DNA-binding protein
MMERDGICNIAGTAKHYAQEPSSVSPLVRTPLSHDVPRASVSSEDHVAMTLDDDYRVREALQRLLAASNLRAVAFGSAAEYFAYPKPDVPASSRPRGGLAPWQAKRIRSYIEGKLDSSIRATDLAGVVQLSPSHFFRAFRKTFGESPLAYIMQRRIRRAQELMLASRISLSQVALECGMCDQAHFSRAFRRIVGTNPNAWRRQFPVDAAPDSSVVGQIPIRTAR